MNLLKILQSTQRLLLLYLIPIDVAFAAIYLISSIFLGKAIREFDFDTPRTIPVLFAACKLFIIGFLLVIASVWRRWELPKNSWRLLLAVGAAFIYVSMDKVWKIHLLLHRFDWMPEFKGGGGEWVFFYLPVMCLTILLGYPYLISLWRSYSKSTFFVVLGICIFILGGMGVEIINDQFFSLRLFKIADHLDSTTAMVNAVKDTIEEFTELLGESITLYGLVLFFATRLKKASGYSTR